MGNIIDSVLTVAYLFLLTVGSGYTVKKVYSWSRNIALEKAATGFGSLEAPNRIMTGGKLDF